MNCFVSQPEKKSGDEVGAVAALPENEGAEVEVLAVVDAEAEEVQEVAHAQAVWVGEDLAPLWVGVLRWLVAVVETQDLVAGRLADEHVAPRWADLVGITGRSPSFLRQECRDEVSGNPSEWWMARSASRCLNDHESRCPKTVFWKMPCYW
jgi:hypothetical protein